MVEEAAVRWDRCGIIIAGIDDAGLVKTSGSG